jgi:hypothetical protein
MKKLTGIIITFLILTILAGCKKKDVIVEDYTPTLTSIDITGAKFLLAGNRISDSISLTKISRNGIETPILLLDEKSEPVEWKYIENINFPFSINKYVGMLIKWRINAAKSSYNENEQNSFYLINKDDSKIVFTHNFNKNTILYSAIEFKMDQNDIIYYLSNPTSYGYSLYKYSWNEANELEPNNEVIDKDVEKGYYLTPKGDLAYIKDTIPADNLSGYRYTFKFSDGSQLLVPSWGTGSYTPDKSYGIHALGVNCLGYFCAYYKNLNGNSLEMKTLQTYNGKRDFWYCNLLTKSIDKFHIVRGQLFGEYEAAITAKAFLNLTNCGSYKIYSSVLPNPYFYHIWTSQDYFYSCGVEKDVILRFYPEDGVATVWKTIPKEWGAYNISCDFSADNFAVLTIFSTIMNRQVLLDANGNELAQKANNLATSIVIL